MIVILLKLKLFRCRLNSLLNMLDCIGDKRSYHVTMVILWKKEIHPPPPSKHWRKIRNLPKTYKGIFLPPSRPLSVYVWGLILWIWRDEQAPFLFATRNESWVGFKVHELFLSRLVINLCSAFSTQWSLRSASKPFFIDSSHFREPKTP